MDKNKLRARVATLDKLLDDFDEQLDDLLAKSLPETLLGLDNLQQAKLQVTIPYLVYDLVIIYLKTKGIDPRTHAVFRELERVKEYIGKVSKVEKRESEQQRMTVDKSAANRFIKHAIAQAVGAQGQPSEPAVQGSTPGPSKVQEQPIPAGAVTKIIARAEWEKQVQEAEGEEEEDLEVFDEAEGPNLEIAEDKAPKSTPTRTGETTDFSEQRSATAKKVKKKHKKAKLPLTGSVFTADTNAGTGFTDVSSNLQVAPPQPEAHADPTPDATEANNGKKRPSELLTGDPEDPSHASALATASAPPKKKQKRNKKKGSQTTTATEIDGITTSRSQSHSRSRDVSVPSVPQVATQSLSGVETDLPTRDAADKPTRWKKRDRKNRNTNAQQATTETTGSQH